MRPLLLLAAATLPAAWAFPGQAQEHGAHHAHPVPAEAVDHAAMEHGAAHATAGGPVEASGTARLPQPEGMMPGLHFDLGSGWNGMAHGYAWGVYTEQTGPRGDDKLYVQSMARSEERRVGKECGSGGVAGPEE